MTRHTFLLGPSPSDRIVSLFGSVIPSAASRMSCVILDTLGLLFSFVFVCLIGGIVDNDDDELPGDAELLDDDELPEPGGCALLVLDPNDEDDEFDPAEVSDNGSESEEPCDDMSLDCASSFPPLKAWFESLVTCPDLGSYSWTRV